jgi:ADP-ribosylglycohydrolase
MLVAIAMQRAQMTGSDFEIQRDDCLNLLMEATHIPELRERLIALSSLLAQDQSLESAAELLGFKDCMAPSLVDSALLGIYSWLHHEGDYRSAVEEVVMLGGDSISAAVVAGALAGAELGVEAIPRDWIERTSMAPYERGWRERYIERLRDWPHGPEDILRTRPLPVMRLRQVLRNIQFSGWWITLPLRRLLSGLSRVKRDRW